MIQNSNATPPETKKVQTYWDRLAPFYEYFILRYFSACYKTSVEKFISKIRKKNVVLEVTAGTGIVTFELAKRAKRVCAVDIAPEMVKIASGKYRLKNIEFCIGDVCNLSFKDKKFDFAVCFNGLHMIKNPIQALSEMRRVLKPDGQLITTTFCYGDYRALWFKFFLLFSGWFYTAGYPPYLHQFDLHSLSRTIEKAGFTILEQEYIWHNPPSAYIQAVK